MDTIDRPDSNVPARYPGESPRMPVPFSAPSRDLAVAPQPSTPQITPRILIPQEYSPILRVGNALRPARMLPSWLFLAAFPGGRAAGRRAVAVVGLHCHAAKRDARDPPGRDRGHRVLPELAAAASSAIGRCGPRQRA